MDLHSTRIEAGMLYRFLKTEEKKVFTIFRILLNVSYSSYGSLLSFSNVSLTSKILLNFKLISFSKFVLLAFLEIKVG
jgi:hypothetical protein